MRDHKFGLKSHFDKNTLKPDDMNEKTNDLQVFSAPLVNKPGQVWPLGLRRKHYALRVGTELHRFALGSSQLGARLK